MEPEDVFADDVDVGGPEVVAVGGVDGGSVVEEGVDPDVDAVGRIGGHLDAPVRVGRFGVYRAGDGDVLEALLEAAHDFVAAGGGEDEVGVCFDEVEQGFFVFGEFEEVVLLGALFEGLAGDGGFVFGFAGGCLGDVFVLGDVVPADVIAQVDIAGCFECGDVLGDFLGVAGFGGAEEIGVGEPEGLEGGLEGFGVLGGPLERGEIPLGRGGSDAVGVFVCAGEEEDVLAGEALEARGDIGDEGGVAVADVWRVVDVVDGGGDVVLGSGGGHEGIVEIWRG